MPTLELVDVLPVAKGNGASDVCNPITFVPEQLGTAEEAKEEEADVDADVDAEGNAEEAKEEELEEESKDEDDYEVDFFDAEYVAEQEGVDTNHDGADDDEGIAIVDEIPAGRCPVVQAQLSAADDDEDVVIADEIPAGHGLVQAQSSAAVLEQVPVVDTGIINPAMVTYALQLQYAEEKRL